MRLPLALFFLTRPSGDSDHCHRRASPGQRAGSPIPGSCSWGKLLGADSPSSVSAKGRSPLPGPWGSLAGSGRRVSRPSWLPSPLLAELRSPVTPLAAGVLLVEDMENRPRRRADFSATVRPFWWAVVSPWRKHGSPLFSRFSPVGVMSSNPSNTRKGGHTAFWF